MIARNPFTIDSNGFLIEANGAIIRRLTPTQWALFVALDRQGHLSKLIDRGLVETQAHDPKNCTVQHGRIPFVTYPSEWTMSMLREAAFCTIDLAHSLATLGMRLHDAHPWNVTFLNGTPRLLDYSSIELGPTPTSSWIDEFYSHFYIPLWLASKKRWFGWRLCHYAKNELHSDWMPDDRLGPIKHIFTYKRTRHLAYKFQRLRRRYRRDGNYLAFLSSLRDHMESLDISAPGGEWSGYPEPGGQYGDLSSYSLKARAVASLLEKVAPGRLLDIGCNSGWITGLAAASGHCALGIDTEEQAVDRAWERAREVKCMDVAHANALKPTPSFGRGLSYPDARARWRANTVMMISVMHHLCLRQSVSFAGLVAMGRQFDPSAVIVEFVPAGDMYVRQWLEKGVAIPPWYCEEGFIEAWRSEYPCWTKMESAPVPHSSRELQVASRSLYLFSR